MPAGLGRPPPLGFLRTWTCQQRAVEAAESSSVSCAPCLAIALATGADFPHPVSTARDIYKEALRTRLLHTEGDAVDRESWNRVPAKMSEYRIRTLAAVPISGQQFFSLSEFPAG